MPFPRASESCFESYPVAKKKPTTMSTGIEVLGAAVLAAGIIAIGAQWAADRLADGLSLRMETALEAIQTATETISEATFAYPPRPTRTITAESGTKLAYVVKTNGELQIRYAPVLAFAESHSTYWNPLVPIGGKVQERDCFSDRILLPGEALTEIECVEMTEEYEKFDSFEA